LKPSIFAKTKTSNGRSGHLNSGFFDRALDEIGELDAAAAVITTGGLEDLARFAGAADVDDAVPSLM